MGRKASKVYKQDIIQQVARMTDFRKSDVEECLKAYYVCVRKNLLDQKTMRIEGVGEFAFAKVAGQPERKNVVLNPSFPDIKGDKPATEGFYRLTFKPQVKFKEELKEATYGKTDK